MSTKQEKSFIACIRCDGASMKLFDQMLSSDWFETGLLREGRLADKGNLLTTNHRYSKLNDNMVQVHRARDPYTRTRSDEMIVYFECHEDYYNIQIRSEAHLGKYFSKNSTGILGAFPGANGETTSYNLLSSDQRILTLDDLTTDEVTVYLKARNAGLIKRQLIQDPKIYCYGDQSGDLVKFNLKILERNVPHPTSTEPYPLYVEPRPRPEDDD